MNVIGFCGPSGVGKTTLMVGVIGELRRLGQRVSVIKHAHQRFDLDQRGKDSFRHREAGASEVLVASNQRLALLREFDTEGLPTVQQLIAEMSPCDWLLVEVYKHAELPKVEVWREAIGEPPLYPADRYVVAVATDAPATLPCATAGRPVFEMTAPHALARWLMDTGGRFHYSTDRHG